MQFTPTQYIVYETSKRSVYLSELILGRSEKGVLYNYSNVVE